MPPEAEPHPLAEGRVLMYGEPPTMPDIDPRHRDAPRKRPRWWVMWWLLTRNPEEEDENGGP